MLLVANLKNVDSCPSKCQPNARNLQAVAFASSDESETRPSEPQEEADAANSSKMIEALYRDHYRSLSVYVRRRLGFGDVDDTVQEIFVNLLRSGEVERLSRPRSYLYRIASNLIVDQQRRRSRVDDQTIYGVDFDSIPHTPNDPCLASEAVARSSLFQIRLADLPEACRSAYLMHHLEGMTCREIAARLEISPRTVNRLIRQALDELGMEHA
jgi:RNA polymerase sigma-70 factor (ECF subfamily)